MGNEEVGLHRASGKVPRPVPRSVPAAQLRSPCLSPGDRAQGLLCLPPWDQGPHGARMELEKQLGQKARGLRGNRGDPRGS